MTFTKDGEEGGANLVKKNFNVSRKIYLIK